MRSGLRTGLRTGSRLQLRNPETFWNVGYDQGFDQGFDQGCDQGCDFDSKPWNGGYEHGFDQGCDQVCDQGCDYDSQPWDDGDDQVSTRVAIRVAIKVSIATLNRNPETYRFGFFLKIATLAVFYGFDYGFGFDRNLLKVFPGSVRPGPQLLLLSSVMKNENVNIDELCRETREKRR